ncbi:MAG: nickel pincer cofactor biosynthesis protein LarC [Candidatus Binatia bacterium]
MKVVYFDAFSGISGDMVVGALLQLGVSFDGLQQELQKLPFSGYRLSQSERRMSGIRATKFQVEVRDPLHERSFRSIARMLQESDLLPQVKTTALRIFTVLAKAEGHVHGVAPEAVHFHEVGAVDSIVDIVGTAYGLSVLGTEKGYVSPLPLGRGLIPSRHGVLPVPGPATVELLKGRPVRFGDGEAEMVTPTGAAIVAAMAEHGSVPSLDVIAVGYGAGERTLSDRPNLLRVVIGNTRESAREEQLTVIETNIDDFNPELYEYVMEQLFLAGARDVFLSPIQMKKGRPGVLLWVLCDPDKSEAVGAVILTETSTLGIRSYPVSRLALRRERRTIQTAYGEIGVKLAYRPDGRVTAAPEYEDCKRVALEKQVPLTLIYEAAMLGVRTLRGEG